jgi:hypothetical protein
MEVGWNDDRRDQSQVDLVRRTILSVNKNPDDPAIFEEYKAAYLRLSRALRFSVLKPSGLTRQ